MSELRSLCECRFVGRIKEQDAAYDEARGHVIGALSSQEVYYMQPRADNIDSAHMNIMRTVFKSNL